MSLSDDLIREVQRQLVLKSEITSVGPPYVILKGAEVLAALADYASKDIEVADAKRVCVEQISFRDKEIAQFRDALTELVALKDIVKSPASAEKLTEYFNRKPCAWARDRELVRGQGRPPPLPPSSNGTIRKGVF